MSRTLPDRIADELIARVFTGELRPGDKLPPDRLLAEELGVDRTSLRSALRQLKRMRLLRPVRGSGVTVLDYRTHAGLDFLAAVLEVPGLELGGAFLLEALDHWERAMPHIVATAFGRVTPAEVSVVDALLEGQITALDAGAPLAEVAALEVDLQDRIVDFVGDVTLRLMANSTRGLRLRLSQLQLELSPDPRAQLTGHRELVRASLTPGAAILDLREAHASLLADQHGPLRAHLASLPPRPHRTSHWERQPASASA